jgi:hypothetical protein
MTKDQEEFDRLRKRLYELADKMGQRMTITIKRKNPFSQPPAPATSGRKREPGDE